LVVKKECQANIQTFELSLRLGSFFHFFWWCNKYSNLEENNAAATAGDYSHAATADDVDNNKNKNVIARVVGSRVHVRNDDPHQFFNRVVKVPPQLVGARIDGFDDNDKNIIDGVEDDENGI
jgi:hypothetical protein